jgi:cellulose synthase/poly-beta-1,6-N-acetylglucosamine synthase-like glycosyltransferase
VYQKYVTLPFVAFLFVVRREQELVDSILLQSDAYSAFSKDAPIRVGGLADKIFGEDGELTNRTGRFDYRLEFEPDFRVFTDPPETLPAFMNQRRWNLILARDFKHRVYIRCYCRLTSKIHNVLDINPKDN